MGLVTTLREVQKNTSPEELNRYDPSRPIMIDGSLSELVTQALNVAYSKRDITSGEPHYGNPNPTGNPPPGAGNVPNIFNTDEPRQDALVKPTLEGMQQMQEAELQTAAILLADAINLRTEDGTAQLKNDPLVIYAIPEDNLIPEEMNSEIDMYGQSGAVDYRDFIFVYTDNKDNTGHGVDYRVVDATTKIKDYEGRGARVYADVQSFLAALPDLRRK